MRIPIRRMGNSQGVLLPKPLLAQIGLEGEAELKVEGNALVLRKPKDGARAGWAQASKVIFDRADDALVMPDFSNDDDADLQW